MAKPLSIFHRSLSSNIEPEASEMAMNTVMCLLTDAEGTPLGSAMYIPHNAGHLQLTNLVNTFLNNVYSSILSNLILIILTEPNIEMTSWEIDNIQEEKLSYSFYVSDEELLVSVGTYMERNSGKTLIISKAKQFGLL